MTTSIDILIPAYKNVELVKQCIDSIVKYKHEIIEHDPRIVVINDSPDDDDLRSYLDGAELDGVVDIVVCNSKNLGFVKSVNKGFGLAKSRGASVFLINSDTVTFPNTLAELVRVSECDEQIAFVCPRSNNASICTFPSLPHNRAGSTLAPNDCYAAWKTVCEYLPRYTFSPTAVGFYMFISSIVIQNFGGLDEVFGVGYEEENDLVMRANKVGFRAVLANHAYAYHAGSASFLLQNLDLDIHRNSNLMKMVDRHPEFLPSVQQYHDSPGYRAERMLRNLVPSPAGKIDVVFDLLAMGNHFNGTNEFIVKVISEIEKLDDKRFTFSVLTNSSVSQFHQFDKLRNIRVTYEAQSIFSIAVCFGQPYDLHSLNVMETLAPINAYGMLDAISWDCQYLRHTQNIDNIWNLAANHSNGLFFISQFGYDTFARRFELGRNTRPFTRLLPTKIEAYRRREETSSGGGKHILIAGNHYSHKDSMRTGQQLAAAFPSVQFCVMGDGEPLAANIFHIKSGRLSDEAMAAALSDSSVVVLPSYYEGFGFSIMHALALQKPIVARDIPVTREILSKFDKFDGIFLFSSNEDIPRAVRSALDSKSSSVGDIGCDNWTEWTSAFLDFLNDLNDPDLVYSTLKERISNGDTLRLIDHLNRRPLDQLNHASPSYVVPQNTSSEVPVTWDGPDVYCKFDDILLIGDNQFVDFLYRVVLNRDPDESGRAHHLALLTEGVSRKEILKAFLGNDEFLKLGRRFHVAGLNTKVGLFNRWFGHR